MNVISVFELEKSKGREALILSNRQLTIGESAAILKARDHKGEEVSYDFSKRQVPTVLYLLSSTCHWCEQNEVNFNELASQAPGKYQLLTLSLEKATDAESIPPFGSHNLYLFEPSVESRLSLNLNSTPATLMFSPDGELKKIWKGAYSDERKADIEKVLGIHLPGLANPGGNEN